MMSRIFNFQIEIPETANPSPGTDPELSPDEQSILDVAWLSLNEIPERDRAYLFAAGLMRIPYFHDEVLKWGDNIISYPAQDNE